MSHLVKVVHDLLEFAFLRNQFRDCKKHLMTLEIQDMPNETRLVFVDNVTCCDKASTASWMRDFFGAHSDIGQVNLFSRNGSQFLISEANAQGIGVWDGWESADWEAQTTVEVVLAGFELTAFAKIRDFLRVVFLLQPPFSLRVHYCWCSATSKPGDTNKEILQFSGCCSNTEQDWRLEKLLVSAGAEEGDVICVNCSFSDFQVHCAVGALCEAAGEAEDAEQDCKVLVVAMQDYLPARFDSASVESWGKLAGKLTAVSDQDLEPLILNAREDETQQSIQPNLRLSTKMKLAHKGKTLLCVLHLVSGQQDSMEDECQQTAMKGLGGLMLEAFSLLSLAAESAQIKELIIPSIANSVCLCIDLHSEETGERDALLSILSDSEDGTALSCPEAHAIFVKMMENESRRTSDQDDSFADTAAGILAPEIRFHQIAPGAADRENVIEYPEKEDDGCLPIETSSHQRILALSKGLKNCCAYAKFFKVFQIVLHLLMSNKISTKRDIFYLDGRLFHRQSQSDSMIELLARAVGVPRHVLNVVSYSRGLVFGALDWVDCTGNAVNCRMTAISMPSQAHSIRLLSEADAIFVLEKECIFRRLIDDNFVHKRFGGRAILITGCGFPDLLNRLSREHATTPVYGIADWDPHGVEIIATYMLGSQARSHEASRLACPTLRWLGIHFEDLRFYGVPRMHFLPLTATDLKKLNAMKRRDALQASAFWRTQLEHISECGFKVEIEAINAVQCDTADPLSFLSDTYVHDKLCRQSFFSAASTTTRS